jgi:sortase A
MVANARSKSPDWRAGVKPLRFFVALILLAGVSLTARAVYLHAKAGLAGILIRRAWQTTARTGATQRPWPWADTYPEARLRIPRLGYDEIVLAGATPRTLAFGPARLQSGAALGEPGNLEIAGHRTSWFEPLQGVALGDTINVEWFDARHQRLRQRTYRINAIRVVNPRDVQMLAATSDDVLTLVTCYPFGRGPRSPQRFLVRASLVATVTVAQASSGGHVPQALPTLAVVAGFGAVSPAFRSDR